MKANVFYFLVLWMQARKEKIEKIMHPNNCKTGMKFFLGNTSPDSLVKWEITHKISKRKNKPLMWAVSHDNFQEEENYMAFGQSVYL